jgi:hypothetical protein
MADQEKLNQLLVRRETTAEEKAEMWRKSEAFRQAVDAEAAKIKAEFAR